MPSTARRGPWSTAEDAFLLSIVQQQGPNNWVRISQLVRTRTPKQCRERFHQNLKPSLNHDPITTEEGELIERLVNEMGKKWAEIARQLNGRSDNAVKNWWNGGQNRRRRMSERRRSEQHAAAAAAMPASQHSSPYPQSYQHHHHAMPSVPMHEQAPYVQPHSYQPMPTNRPSPLTIQPHAYGSRVYDTPIPSPSGQSVMSADGAPSLITDSGSESRSPHYAPSPMEHSLPPLIGRRDERRRSSLAFLPRDGSFVTDDENTISTFQQEKKRDSLRLPEPQGYSPQGPTPMFREPNYAQVSARQMPHLTQGLSFEQRPHPVEPSSVPVYPQRQLPSFHTLTEPSRIPDVRLPPPYFPPVSQNRYPSPTISQEVPRSPPSASKPNAVASLLN